MHGSGWWSYIRYDEEQDRLDLTPRLLQRVAAYARPYLPSIGLMLLTILISTLLSLVPPLLYRDLIDHALPQRDLARLNLLALGMIGIPLLSGLVGVAQRYLSAAVGEGVIFDLRRALFEHMQRMSLRFFTHTHSGELVSRLNNDVIGAQRAVSSTLVSLVSNVIAVAGTLAIMVSLDWRLTLIGVAIFPLFILPARRLGRVLRKVTRDSLKLNAEMNVVMNETLNVSGALLVKIFGRSADENARFADRAAAVRDVGIRSAVLGRWFFLGLGLAEAVGTAVVFWTGGFLVLQQELTVGTIVAFGAYLTQFYSPVSSLTNARVDLATSLVSFERVFEVLDLPVEIGDQPGAIELSRVQAAFDLRMCGSDMRLLTTAQSPSPRSSAGTPPRWHASRPRAAAQMAELALAAQALVFPPTARWATRAERALSPSGPGPWRGSRSRWLPASLLPWWDPAVPARPPSPTCCHASTT